MKTLLDVVERSLPARPWTEGDNIPWNDPAFSQRMLNAHLCQEHDLASRRFDVIDRHVAWIHEVLLSTRPTRILDLTCGPGLYTSRLARLGHRCVGVDFSPASVEHAAQYAQNHDLACSYLERDLRKIKTEELGGSFGFVMMLWGQINVFRRDEVKRILNLVHEVSNEGGELLLEPQTVEQIRKAGSMPPTWSATRTGLFSERPHLVLEESFWEEALQTSTHRFCVVDAQSGAVTRHALSNEAYSREQWSAMLEEAHYRDIRFLPGLTGPDAVDNVTFSLTATA